MNKNKMAVIFIHGFGCSSKVQEQLLNGINILDKLEDILSKIDLHSNSKYIIGSKTYSAKEIKELQSTINILNTKSITYIVLYLLKNKHLLRVFNDIYLLNFNNLNLFDVNNKVTIDTLHIMCDSTIKNQFKNISKYFCNINRYSNMNSMKIEDNTYYEKSLNTILKYIKDPYYNNVIVIGHSYGGSMVSKVAKYLNNIDLTKKEISKLQMATIGSIYIPPYFKTNKIKLHHYVYRNDPAFTKCSRIKDISNYPNLHVMKSTRDSFKENEELFKLLNKDNLEAHINYSGIVKTILNKKNTKIDINKLE